MNNDEFNCDCGGIVRASFAGTNRKIKSKKKQYLFPENYSLLICNICDKDWLFDSQIDELNEMIVKNLLVEVY